MINVQFRDAADAHYSLVEVPAEREDLLEQVAGKDRVHLFGADTVDALRQYRVAGKGYAKTAFAITSTDTGRVRSIIFGQKVATPLHSPIDIPGNVHAMLNQPSRTPFEGDPTGMVFYSISSFDSGSGPLLINSLLEINEGSAMCPATLSPLRTLQATFPNFNPADMSPAEKTVLAYLHLMGFGERNPVQNFHMGNGARIGDINTDANTPESEDGREGMGVMINYVYSTDRKERDNNRALYKAINKGQAPAERMVELMHPALVTKLRSMPVLALMARTTGPNAAYSSLVYS